jgi:uncharacterized protein
MTAPVLVAFALLVASTAFLAGVFGMAGGMILMGGLLLMMSVPEAMMLHGITQVTSNGWRALLWFRWIDRRIVLRYLIGLIMAVLPFSAIRFVPAQGIVFLCLGIVPFLARVLPQRMVPQAGRPLGAEICGFVCTSLQLLSGVSGPMLDVFFARSQYDRRLVVATKAACQILTHLAKLAYFGFLIGGSAVAGSDPVVVGVAITMALLGTTLSRHVLERLTDQNFRAWTWWLVLAIGAVYIARGLVELA